MLLLDWDLKVNAEGSLDSLCISGAPLMQVLWAMAAVRTYPCLASNILFPCALSKACASSIA